MEWYQLEVTVPYLKNVQLNQYVIILESSTNQTGFITAVRNLSLSVNDCRPIPYYIELTGQLESYYSFLHLLWNQLTLKLGTDDANV